jgi:hypothetical protein
LGDSKVNALDFWACALNARHRNIKERYRFICCYLTSNSYLLLSFNRSLCRKVSLSIIVFFKGIFRLCPHSFITSSCVIKIPTISNESITVALRLAKATVV